VLCGSAMGFIEDKVLSEKEPLYGRATGIYKMNELPFSDVIKFFPEYSDEDLMLTYSILGGIPHYLRQFDSSISVQENIIRNILTKGCALYSEVEFLIRQELREPMMYNTLLEAIALGNTQLNEIHSKTQVESSKISVYLKNLIQLRLLEREFSVLSSNKELSSSTKGVYQINDKFFRFWYKFILPNLSDLEMGDANGVYSYAIQPQLNDFSSPVFEEICRTFIRKLNQNMELSFRLKKLGRWWGKLNRRVEENGKIRMRSEESEIDILGFDEGLKNYLVGECKYTNSKVDLPVLEHLMGKVECLGWNASLCYVLFSKSGFTKGVEEKAREANCILYTLDDVIAYLKKEKKE
jgi:AAA+ ATPase superfamily predicted ATPase